jgi:ABC-type antimicrobial peptide transport system permease subunit
VHGGGSAADRLRQCREPVDRARVARQKEIAVRLSVGASQSQLVRQLLVESLVLAVASGTLGILLAVWITKGLLSLLPTGNAVLMLSGFGALATLLASIGLYGVMAFVVARRTKEIGVRLALGAMRGSVVWLVMREVLLLLGLGLAVGIPAALALGRFISAQLYGVKENDLWVAGIAVILLSLIAAMAGLVPARRASRIDPLLALRYE